MRTFKTVIILVLILIGGLALNGCKERGALEDSQTIDASRQTETSALKESSPELSGKNQELDSLGVKTTQIEALSNVQEANNERETSGLSGQKAPSHLIDFISLIVVVISLTLAIIALVKCYAIQKRVNNHCNDIVNLRSEVEALNQKTTIGNSSHERVTNAGLSSNEYTALASRIYKLEQDVKALRDIKHHGSDPQKSGSDFVVNRNNNERNGFFGVPAQKSLTEAYFNHFYESRDSEAKFSVIVRDSKAEFSLLEGHLNDVRSLDVIKLALDLNGCALSEATQMKTVVPGEAKKEGDRWIITKKTSIFLQK